MKSMEDVSGSPTCELAWEAKLYVSCPGKLSSSVHSSQLNGVDDDDDDNDSGDDDNDDDNGGTDCVPAYLLGILLI